MQALAAGGFTSHHAATAADGLAAWRSDPAITGVTLDRMLPDGDGLELVAAARAAGLATPLLMLSALGDVDHRVAGLRAGGDDYLVKPFDPAELVARIEALLRRGRAETALVAGGIMLDLLARQARVNGKAVRLLAMEFRLLEFLMRNRGRAVGRKLLFEQVWGYHFDPGANVIAVHIGRLRRKLAEAGVDPITTVKGEGYRFDGD